MDYILLARIYLRLCRPLAPEGPEGRGTVPSFYASLPAPDGPWYRFGSSGMQVYR